MARATHVQAAARDYPESECGIPGGIKKGQSYYWWKFKRGGKRFSLSTPRRSQLTQSAYLSQLYDIQDRLAGLEANDSLKGEIESIAEDLRSLAEECQGSLDSMPESLQRGPTGELLQERIDACESAADELEGIEIDDEFTDEDEGDFDPDNVDREEGATDEEHEEAVADARREHEEGRAQREEAYWQEKLEEAQAVSIDG